ncbi:hypothetical protein ACQCVO_16395 [Bacillus infantis]|uniref:hypothetical protein n=1 Tax=Bacillus infantis TaxID=324767 RepID=UPI003CEFEF6A
MKNIEKYSKIMSGNEYNAIGIMYFADLYKAVVLVDLKDKTFYINDMVNFPNTNFSSFDEVINKVIEHSGINSNANAVSITKDEFHEILQECNLGADFIIKIKQKLPDEVIKNMLENN